MMLIKFLYDIWKTTLILKTHVNIQWLYLSLLANRRNKKKKEEKGTIFLSLNLSIVLALSNHNLIVGDWKKKKKLLLSLRVA